MSFCLIPDVILKRLTELTPELLSARGISFLMMDFGLTSILVSAIDNHTIWLKLRHVAELPFIAWGKRRIRYEKH